MPLHRYCDFCWNLRPDWLPSNGARTHRPTTLEHRDLSNTVESRSSPGFGGESLPASLDSGMSPGSCDVSFSTDEHNPAFPDSVEIPMQLAETPVSATNAALKTSENIVATKIGNRELIMGDGDRAKKSGEYSDLTAVLGPLRSANDVTSPSSVCLICLVAPKNASIVHGSTGHQACCFRCARRLKQSGKHCPVCRRPIHKVIRNYVV